MDKIAQSERGTGRGFFNKFRETMNMPGKYLDGVFRPEIERIMADLKEKDDTIRSIFTGKTIGKVMPTDNLAIKDILKSANKNFNRREYMSAVIDLGHFHKKMLEVSNTISEFKLEVDKIHHKFLFEGLKDTGYDKKLEEFRNHIKELQEKKAEYFPELVKEAGMIDDIFTFLSRRGRGLMAWEKRYPQKVKDLRDGAQSLLGDAQKMFESNVASLKAMATSRATRRPDEYMEHANKIKADFDKFNAKFKEFYTKAVQPWLQVKDSIEAKEKGEAAQAGTGGPTPGVQPQTPDLSTKQPSPSTVTPSVISPSSGVPPMGSGFIGLNPPGSSPPFTPPPQQPAVQEEEKAPDTARKPVVTGKHQAFYNSLESLSKESPQILAKYISKYATSIQVSDPETAISLFKISQRIKG